MKEPKQISVGRILINQLILWPVMHAILAFVTMGVWILIGWIPQLIDLCYSINRRSKYAKWQHEQLLEAVRGGQR